MAVLTASVFDFDQNDLDQNDQPVQCCLFLIWLTVYCFFPDVVDSRFPELVDNLLETLTPLLKRLSFVFRCYKICKKKHYLLNFLFGINIFFPSLLEKRPIKINFLFLFLPISNSQLNLYLNMLLDQHL